MNQKTRETLQYAVVLAVLLLTIMGGTIYSIKLITATEADRERINKIETSIGSIEKQLQAIEGTMATTPDPEPRIIMDEGARQQIDLLIDNLALLKSEVHSYSVPVQEWLNKMQRK